MKLLLDTHIAIWAVANSPRLPESARELIADAQNEIVVSVASRWEIATKRALRRRTEQMPISAAEGETYFRAAGYRLLSVAAEHIRALEQLPAHHADPFDRLLVAQATHESAELLTADARLTVYGEMVRSA